jgi:prophage regulatory protein
MTRNVDSDSDPARPSTGRGAATPALRILRLKEVCKMVGLGRSFVYRLQTENRFPHSIKIGVRAVGWLEDEVRVWLAERIADSRRGKPDAN